MKRIPLLIVVLFSLIGLVGCINKNEISKMESDKQTSIETNVASKDKLSENLNSDVRVGTQSNTITENDVQDITSFIPKGWHILEKSDGQLASAEGDLNKDGIIDKVVVIEETNQMEYAPSRNLLIAFGNEDGTYTLSIKAEKAILLRNEGGPFGDPFDEIIIDRGSIMLKFFGGSSERWYLKYRFRYQNNGWYLIGATEGGFVDVNDDMLNEEEDYNLLTGDYIIRKLEDGRIITIKGNRGKKQLLNLKDFIVDSYEKQF
ncbi:hypothetical protein [Crassaminicella profunda]|uniref:hypothetical protein n=1 Tax=Crassaminicella profunda TaxID=1286698 RepID=UPI001CA6E116|nr:hypothetical protein [Crassaminicella profunda]QZY53937.1 hypothetical protein K7H06_12835 [Crassaminicella profunda]